MKKALNFLGAMGNTNDDIGVYPTHKKKKNRS